MGNQDAGNALPLELQHQLQQIFAIVLVQRRRRFVQNEQLYPLGQCFRNFHQLLLANPDVGNQRIWVFC
ncbi:hypothetical protein D3C71_2036610 [compost metagenome]